MHDNQPQEGKNHWRFSCIQLRGSDRPTSLAAPSSRPEVVFKSCSLDAVSTVCRSVGQIAVAGRREASVTCRSLQEKKDGIASQDIRLWLSSRLVPRTSFSPSQVTDRRISHGWTASPSTSGLTYVARQGLVLGNLPAPLLALLCHRHPSVFAHLTRLVVPAGLERVA
jgi:hypothetical protein